MSKSPFFGLAALGRNRLILVGFLLSAIILGVSILGTNLVRQIEAQSETRTDNAQWFLSQFELELLLLVNAADRAAEDDLELSEVRLRYDIFFGRLAMLREGLVSAELRTTPNFASSSASFDAFLNKYLPVMEGSDAMLRARLPEIIKDGRALVPTARSLSLLGVKITAQASDARRALVGRTLLLTGAMTAILVVFLLALLLVLLLFHRRNRESAAENLAMLSRLDAVVGAAMEALITVDHRGRIVDFNEAARQIFGASASEVREKSFADFCTLSESEAMLLRPDTAPNVASQGRFRAVARKQGGEEFPAEVSISRVLGIEPALFVIFLRDLSGQLGAEQALVDARDRALAGEKAKADLLAVMSHEIRTPLNGVIGTIELLEAGSLSKEQQEYLRILKASGQLLMHHVNDVLDVARLDSGRAKSDMRVVDLAEIAREVVENQQPASRLNGNTLTLSLPDGETFHVRSDGARLRQILLNLVGNAVKFTSDGKIEVIIEANSDVAGTRICVKDSGIGIAQPDLNRIFDDFVTLDPSFSRRSSGTGLGLGIVRRIVRQMDGRLQVESQLGVGSTFSVYLPLSRLGAPEAAEDLPSRAATGPALSVLVVEDNEFNRVIVTEFLRHDGHEVEEAADAESGIDMAAGRHFDVILMDISMPGMDGLQAAGVIRAGQGESRATPIIAMTAHALPEDRARFRAGGMAVVLTKPITRESLRRALRDAVQDHEEKSGPPVMNRAILEGLGQDLGQERAEKLLGAFRAELGTLGGKVLAAASGKSSVVDTARLAHQLAGSASMFGATALAEVLHLVESAWRANTALAPEVKARLVNVLAETEAAYQDADFAQPSSLR